MYASRVYDGPVRNLVLGIDVGTTFSGVSYAILDPGQEPNVHNITRYPGQEDEAGNSRIPSILWYRPDGSVHSAGAEAMAPGIDLIVQDECLSLAKWFKLHLRPESLDSDCQQRVQIPPLPPNKTVVDVFADFLRYLVACTRSYICETHSNGESLWNSVQNSIEFVLTHPNGWEGLQQEKMRKAAVIAGLVPDTCEGQSRIHLVTEGEASLNFCITSGLTTSISQDGKSVIVVDAGGGTVDISSYRFLSMDPISVEEATAPACLLQGSTQVNCRLYDFLKCGAWRHLASATFGNEEDIKLMVDRFDQFTKPVFKDERESSYIKFGTMKDNDPAVNISRGQLKLSGQVICDSMLSDMASFFRPALDSIFNAIKDQRGGACATLSTVFLVGGFAANAWLCSSLKEKLKSCCVTLYRPDSHTSKAVADGAVYFFLDHFVLSRVAKMTYGTKFSPYYNANDPEHVARHDAKYGWPDGTFTLPQGFKILLQKGTHVHEKDEISTPLCQKAKLPDASNLRTIECNFLSYKGTGNPKWVDVDPAGFISLCTVCADTALVNRQPKQGPLGIYYQQDFKFVLLCGLTELKVQISWMENGIEKRGPATVVYNNDYEVSR
ncbi:hypothetical protein LXA43DRAFT_1121934 [Ganoderma leucocontextum]|nr:hypothetical protein LXA43DRAFT_1121934 [Ganoderma leucocontextum]